MEAFKILKYHLIILLLIITGSVYAQDITLNFNSGYIGYGGNFPLNNYFDSGSFYTLFNIGIEHEPTNIGLEFSPYTYFSWANSGEAGSKNGDFNHCFFNLKLYWNTFNFLDGLIYLGPFAFVNYLFVGEKIFWDKYIFTVGGNIGLKLNIGRLNYNIVSAEMGYRNINGTSNYFVGAKIDIISFVLLVILSRRNSESENSSSK